MAGPQSRSMCTAKTTCQTSAGRLATSTTAAHWRASSTGYTAAGRFLLAAVRRLVSHCAQPSPGCSQHMMLQCTALDSSGCVSGPDSAAMRGPSTCLLGRFHTSHIRGLACCHSQRMHVRMASDGGGDAEHDRVDASQPEEVLLDENEEAAKHSFYMVGALETSPDHKLLAYAEDTTGGEKYTLCVRELATGKQLLKLPITVGCVPAPAALHILPSRLASGVHACRRSCLAI